MEKIVRRILMLVAAVLIVSAVHTRIASAEPAPEPQHIINIASHQDDGTDRTEKAVTHSEAKEMKKVLVFGDSMTGWMAERINEYGKSNGFDVATVIWDGSTIRKWSDHTKRLKEIIAKEKPDQIIVSLGMNEMFEAHPSRLEGEVDKIISQFGDTPYLWVGPPSWPGKSQGKVMTDWMAEKLGDNFYNSISLNLPRQTKTNPHPTRTGMCTWADKVMKVVEEKRSLSLETPTSGKMSQPKSYTYRKMKENL